MRKNIVAGNWKMNGTLQEAKQLTSEIIHMIEDEVTHEVTTILCPPSPLLGSVGALIGSQKNIYLGAQNCHEAASGAYTGEISAEMIHDLGAQYVILGHSERREYFGETDALLHKKVTHALDKGLSPLFCCGEQLAAREENKQETIVYDQIANALFSLPAEALKKIIIAYEPVWAIGTGKTATASQAQEMHAFIRSKIADAFGAALADEISILYGGSVKPGNAQEIFSQPDVDGGLIGGASLKSRDFVDIVKAIG